MIKKQTRPTVFIEVGCGYVPVIPVGRGYVPTIKMQLGCLHLTGLIRPDPSGTYTCILPLGLGRERKY